MRHFFIIILFSLFVTSSHNVQSQDSLAPLKDFLNMSNAYQQNTLHLKLTVENRTNIPVLDTDTSVINAEFFVTKAGSYLQFGQFEQLVNDSQALLISNQQQRMILYNNAEQLLRQSKLTKGWMMSDTSVGKLAKLFKGSYSNTGNYPSIILTGKELLNGTSFPKQELRLIYNPATKIPVEVSTLNRILVPEQSIAAEVNTQLPNYNNRVSIDGQSFIVKEQYVVYRYHTVEYANVQVPFSISDRLLRNVSGDFTPVPSFENFAVTIY